MEIRHYPALVYRSGEGYGVVFPDLDGCVSYGDTLHLASTNCEEALSAHLDLMVQKGEKLPASSTLDDVTPDPDGVAIGRMLVRVEVPCRWIRVNLSMADTLVTKVDHAAKTMGMTRSGFLSEAARRMLEAV
ncbi:MAG: type II toxin-antitoxin system HicB family antitoxin [Magnetococcales bacterium]|nr:type II toxin-antitoxin system HicB family antitoxin [Magnetococcales bacterium]